MTFQQAIDRLKITVGRTDLEADLPEFLNAAVRRCADRHSFDEMKKTGSVTIASAASTIALPDDFKEFQNGRFPVLDKIGAAAAVPTPVYARSELERLAPVFRPALHLIYTQDNGGFQLTLPAAATATNLLTLYYFAFPAVVTDMGQSTPLLLSFENMVLEKAAAIAFESINDPATDIHNAAFERELAIATGKDIDVSKPDPRAEKE